MTGESPQTTTQRLLCRLLPPWVCSAESVPVRCANARSAVALALALYT